MLDDKPPGVIAPELYLLSFSSSLEKASDSFHPAVATVLTLSLISTDSEKKPIITSPADLLPIVTTTA